MGSVRSARSSEGVDLQYCEPEQLRGVVAELTDPWIADEGPTDCGFRQGLSDERLRQRGLAFDDNTTVVWDEAMVQIIRRADPVPGVVSLKSEVLVRLRPGWPRYRSRLRVRSGYIAWCAPSTVAR
jgi:hypothetical protein